MSNNDVEKRRFLHTPQGGGPRAENLVGSPELQAFSGAMRQALAEEGYFVTTSRFTPAAQRWAKREGMYLIDGAALVRWQQHFLPATSTTRQQSATNNL